MHTKASDASLLLNLESVFTALLAWLVSKKNADRRIVLGMAAIVVGEVLLSWADQRVAAGGSGLGPSAIALACLCWAIDYNLTRKVSAVDAYFSTAPFVGAAASLVFLGEAPSLLFWPACALMTVGVWLHLTERHEHRHTHEPREHSHRHVHDEHH